MARSSKTPSKSKKTPSKKTAEKTVKAQSESKSKSSVTASNAKSKLIGLCQKQKRGRPVFKSQLTGPEHEPTFVTAVHIDGEVFGTGEGHTKKDAEKNAAQDALGNLSKTLPETASVDTLLQQEEAFEGPWPIFPEVLSESLEIAHARVDARLKGENARIAIQEFSLELYKGLLENLGEVVEIEEEE